MTKTRSCQVKSSINQINLPDAKRWADELERHSRADELTLILVGPCSSQVARMERYGNVDVPCPKNADFEGLIGLAAHLLDRFLVQENIKSQSPHHREMMVDTLITKLSILASNGSPIERKEFINLIKGWILTVSAPVILTWELVDFSRQRGVETRFPDRGSVPRTWKHVRNLIFVSKSWPSLKDLIGIRSLANQVAVNL